MVRGRLVAVAQEMAPRARARSRPVVEQARLDEIEREGFHKGCHARISLIEHEQVEGTGPLGCGRQLPEQRRPSDETHIGLEHARVVAAPAQLG